MAERITITIPTILHQRLQVVKDGINISGTCQEAIEKAVQIQEIKSKEIPQMEKLIERLKIEKREELEDWKNTGIAEGKEDATELSYAQFKNLETTQKIDEELLETIKETRLEYLENPNVDTYLEGWLEGALSVWDEVKEHLNS